MLTKKVQVQMDSLQNLTDLLKRPKNDAPKLVHKIHNEVTVPNSICEISISLISKSDKDTHLHAYMHKKFYQPFFLIHRDVNILSKIQIKYKNIWKSYSPWPSWLYCRDISMVQLVLTDYIISIDTEKAFYKKPTSLHGKNPIESKHGGNMFQHNKGNIW